MIVFGHAHAYGQCHGVLSILTREGVELTVCARLPVHGIKQRVKLRYVTPFCTLSLVALLTPMIASAQTAVAAVPPQPTFSEVISKMAPMFLIVFVVFHFFIIKPQKKKEEDHVALLKELKVGESIVTSSGIIGRVAMIASDAITVEIAQNVKVKFSPSSILKREDKKEEK